MNAPRGDGPGYKVVVTALRFAVGIIIMLVAAWAVDVSRRIEGIEGRQRDVLIRLRTLEFDHHRRFGEPPPP